MGCCNSEKNDNFSGLCSICCIENLYFLEDMRPTNEDIAADELYINKFIGIHSELRITANIDYKYIFENHLICVEHSPVIVSLYCVVTVST